MLTIISQSYVDVEIGQSQRRPFYRVPLAWTMHAMAIYNDQILSREIALKESVISFTD